MQFWQCQLEHPPICPIFLSTGQSMASFMRNYPSEPQKPTLIMDQHSVLHVNGEPEDTWHFLGCHHLDHKKIFTVLKGNLTQKTQKLQHHQCVFTMLWLGLAAITMDTPYPNVLEDGLPPLWQLINSQVWLGWEQLYQGQFSSNWATAINAIHPHLAALGNQVTFSIIKIIWTYVIFAWKLRNTHLQQNATNLDLPNYKNAIKILCKQKHMLSTAAQEALYRQPIEQILEQPAPQMQNWVTCWYRYSFTKQLWAEKKQKHLAHVWH